MRGDISPYRGARVALATMHSKDRAMQKPLRQRLAIALEVVSSIDTDVFGTFTGKIPRTGSMLDAARRKALSAIAATGLPYGVGSEGSFGPHPAMPFLPSGTELIAFVDRCRDLEISEVLRTHRTNFGSLTAGPRDDLSAFLKSARFPSHALVVSPNRPLGQKTRFQKGIVDARILTAAIVDACAHSADGRAQITTDMRAQVNPTRMASIRTLTRRLAERLATPCPACRAPGFGKREIERGLPCSDCGEPTELAMSHLERCVRCTFVRRMSVADDFADPGSCLHCNP